MEYQFPKIMTDNTINQQVWKVCEEMLEVEVEHEKIITASIKNEPYNYIDLAIETLDIMQACETLLQKLPLSKYEIDRLHKGVIQKNKRRGYYKEG